jgi:hypothetical protein
VVLARYLHFNGFPYSMIKVLFSKIRNKPYVRKIEIIMEYI